MGSERAKLFLITLTATLSASSAFDINSLPDGFLRHSAPYIVQVRDAMGLYLCEGVLMGQMVVTAVQCVKGRDPGDLMVIGGVRIMDDNGPQRKVRQIRVPDACNTEKPENLQARIAVLMLEENFETSRDIENISFGIDALPEIGDILRIESWKPDRLVKLRVISHQDCVKTFVFPPTHYIYCAILAEDNLQGFTAPAGSPIVRNGKLYGLNMIGRNFTTETPVLIANVYETLKFVTADQWQYIDTSYVQVK